MKKKVSVVGAGMGGLSAAIELIHAGYDVEIYEQNEQAGGKMHQLKFSGHTFDVGPTLVMMPKYMKRSLPMSVKSLPTTFLLSKLTPCMMFTLPTIIVNTRSIQT